MTGEERMVFENINPAETGSPEAITVTSLHFAYDGTTVLENINLSVGEGEFLSLLGPSGSGKTTLLRLLAGIESPDTGCISCRGKPVSGPGIDRGMVFQDYSLFPWMNLLENICLALGKAHPGSARSERRELARDYLTMVGLEGLGRKYPFELSGGMRQRVAIARALAMGSPLLLMDEPFGALDPINRMKLQDLLIDVWSRAVPRKTVIFVTHDMDEALFLGDRVVILGSFPGRIMAEVTVDTPRPRSRQTYRDAPELQTLRGRILEVLRRDAVEHLDAVGTMRTPCEGI